MRVTPIFYGNNRQNIPTDSYVTKIPFSLQRSLPSNPYNLSKDQVSFTGFEFQTTVLKKVPRRFMGLGLFKTTEGFTIDFSKIGADKLSQEKFDMVAASDREIYAYWHALACQEAYPEVGNGVGTSWVRRYNKKNVPKPNAVFNTLNNPDIAHENFENNLEELLNPAKHKSLDAPPKGSGADPTLSVITDKNGRIQLSFVCFDTETTGIDKFDKIIQLASIQVKRGRIFKGGVFNRLINPERPIPPETTAVHGITDEMVKDAPTIQGVLEDFLSRHMNKNNGIIVAYNSKFDLNLLNNAIREYPFNPDITARNKNTGDPIKIIATKQPYKVLDPYILIQRIHPYLGARKKLSHQYQWLFCKQMDNAHDALADVRGTIDVLKYCLYYLSKHRKNKNVPLTLREVLIFQNGGRVENIDIPLDVDDCNDLVNFDKSYLMKPMSVANYFDGYKLTEKILKSLASEIGEANVQKIEAQRIVNKKIGKKHKKLPINPAETEQVQGPGGFKDMAYVLEANFRKVLGFAELEPYKGKSKEEIENLIVERSKSYFNGLLEDMHIKNTNPKDIPEGNDLPDIEIARRVIRESREN